jgi:hypothetical protein
MPNITLVMFSQHWSPASGGGMEETCRSYRQYERPYGTKVHRHLYRTRAAARSTIGSSLTLMLLCLLMRSVTAPDPVPPAGLVDYANHTLATGN